jgi:LytS/YehU family sensor histidine kinase
MIPFSTYQSIKSFAPIDENISFLHVGVMSLTLISIFYFNYFILIPKFLLPKRYFVYTLIFIASIASSFLLSFIIFYLTGVDNPRIENFDPVFSKILPVVRANGLLMLIAAIVTSISLVLGNKIKQVEQEKLSAELSSLKAQINPHFLFNVLNSIYATAIEHSPEAADMIEKLSGMMRYSMRETQKDFILLEEELNHIQNYIDLQKIRLSEKIKLEYKVEGDAKNLEIAPMLITPFIENAFKHGVNSEQDSDIKINIHIKEEELFLNITNNKVNTQTNTIEKSGLGIDNTKHRLLLTYPDKHLLKVKDTDKTFSVSLHIDLK